MITHLTIKGFKSLRNVSVELGVLNVFIGPNGAGKSNLIEALGVLGAAARVASTTKRSSVVGFVPVYRRCTSRP